MQKDSTDHTTTQLLQSECGQSSVEYALVLFAFLATITALGALWHVGRDGVLLRLARDAASHALESLDALAIVEDLFLY